MKKIDQILVTSKTTFSDSIDLRKALRDYEGGLEASFLPGIGAFPTTRPSFSPVIPGKTVLPENFQKYANLIAKLYYDENTPVSPASYGLRKEAKIGLPYNSREEEAHFELLKELIQGSLDFSYAGHYVYGSRIQTDSKKIRDTGYIQLKAVGDGFMAQRHRMINAGPAINHLLGIYEFDYHHWLLNRFPQTFNVVVDDFIDTGYAYAWDFKNFERSLGWDILFNSMIERLHYLGRHRHAELFEAMNLQCHIHYRPSFSTREAFESYLRCSDVNYYMTYVSELYGTHFRVDDLVKDTCRAIRDKTPQMEALFNVESTDKRSPLAGYKIYTQDKVYNNSGVATTATVGKLYAIVDFLCRLSAITHRDYDEEFLVKLLLHNCNMRLYNLGDDNLLITDSPFPYEAFLDTPSATVITDEQPTGFLSRKLTSMVQPRFHKNAVLMPQAKSFFRKLSRERDIRSYTVPSEGWTQSYLYAKRNDTFAEHETKILSLFSRLYMSLGDIISDAKNFLDKPIPGVPISAIEFIDDPGKMYAKNIANPVAEFPFLFIACDPYTRNKIITTYGV